ncbi:MAG: PD-(D/E)XK nuclease family protein [Candidatus Woesearchaeota archaeon]
MTEKEKEACLCCKPKRIQSPSSINTYKQCPRKYYYQYIQKLATLPSIHLVRGNIAHSVLENFYDLDLPSQDHERYFKTAIQRLLLFYWQKEKQRLDQLNLNSDQIKFYFEETMLMLMNWLDQFLVDLNKEISSGSSLAEAFQKLTPIRERKYVSDKHSVQGFIDAIHHLEDEVHIVDYKTNANFEFKDSIKLQLAIYSLLYQEKHGKAPSKVGIFFLRHKLKLIAVDEELLELARREINLVHQHTQSEEIEDYPCQTSPLCRWSSGQCDFYDVCKPNNK